MAQVQSQIGLQEALDKGFPSFQLCLNNWGNVGATADADAGSVSFPLNTNIPSLAGVAIDPTSVIDRVQLVGWGAPSPPALATYDFGGRAGVGGYVISKSRPLLGPVLQPRTGEGQPSLTFMATAAELFGDTYLAQAAVAPVTFGRALTAPVWALNMPVLKLILFFRDPVVVPSFRAPFAASWRQTFALLTAETLVKVFPVHGRRAIRAAFRTVSGTGQATIRMTGVIAGQSVFLSAAATQEFQTGPSPFMNFETPNLGGPTMIDAAVGQSVTFPVTDPQITFLLIKMSTSADVVVDCSVAAID